jgi:hypothetical protein
MSAAAVSRKKGKEDTEEDSDLTETGEFITSQGKK